MSLTSPALQGGFFTTSATREAPGYFIHVAIIADFFFKSVGLAITSLGGTNVLPFFLALLLDFCLPRRSFP